MRKLFVGLIQVANAFGLVAFFNGGNQRFYGGCRLLVKNCLAMLFNSCLGIFEPADAS